MNRAFEIALSYYGTKEIVGSKHNHVVVDMFKTVGHSWVKNDETAWCAAFVGHCLERAGKASTRRLNARSYLSYGTGTITPKLGDIVVLWRVGKNTAYGHVGFFVRETKNYVYVLGGNQGNQVNISKYPKSRLLKYRTWK